MKPFVPIRSTPLFFAVVALGLVLSGTPGTAQVVRLDEGSFEIFRDGELVGSESFTVRRVGLGRTASIVLQGRTVLDGIEIESILETTTEWVPLEYQQTRSGADASTIELTAQRQRYTAVTTNARGEGEREFRAGRTTVILDAEVAFLYNAVAARPAADVLTALHPALDRQLRLTLENLGPEAYAFGARTLTVRRLRLEGTEDLRELLVDDQNRVLLVSIPARRWVARRTPE
ncbi:MAG: hypothetical protein RQ745_00725 [Longimicrobiales bacterium]|nr:hypothetical protein [Longimicrobiales bacterium]